MKNLTLFLLFLAISLSFSDDTSPGEETPGCERTPEREGDTLEICKTFIETIPSQEDRHVRRVNKITMYENGEYNAI